MKTEDHKKNPIHQETPITLYMHCITTPLLSHTECTCRNVVIASCCIVRQGM